MSKQTFESDVAKSMQDEQAKRLNQGRESQQLLQNPLISGFFSDHFEACQQAFRHLPMGCPIEQYQTIQHDFLALERLRISLEAYIVRAETDTFERKQRNELPEDIEV